MIDPELERDGLRFAAAVGRQVSRGLDKVAAIEAAQRTNPRAWSSRFRARALLYGEDLEAFDQAEKILTGDADPEDEGFSDEALRKVASVDPDLAKRIAKLTGAGNVQKTEDRPARRLSGIPWRSLTVVRTTGDGGGHEVTFPLDRYTLLAAWRAKGASGDGIGSASGIAVVKLGQNQVRPEEVDFDGFDESCRLRGVTPRGL